ncbi:MAG: hypothetical protein GW938_03815 [Leptospira sp.]|nr:hypothetical protein [Leptospira sp.]NCS92807.1 hypothetical protein [Leptospira sp.]
MRSVVLILLSSLILSTSLLSDPLNLPSQNRGVRKMEKFSFLKCDFQIPEDAYLNYGEGQKKSLRVYPKLGDKFFIVFRELSRILSDQEIKEIFPENPISLNNPKILLFQESFQSEGNQLTKLSILLNESKILIRVFIRKDEEELLQSFLDLQWISSCR